ncbi:MAG: hypothetical protein KGM44_08465 [bacterium]|nr:hypothetical protein [bacterium]
MNDDLAAYLVRVLLRYFRKGNQQFLASTAVHESDRDLLLLQWSVSERVRDLCLYLTHQPHEMQPALQARAMTARGGIRGRICAAESVLLQERSGDGSVFVYDEPFRSFDAGPNRVLGWTLAYAVRLASRFRTLLPPEATYYDRILERLRLLQDVRRALPYTGGPVAVPTAGDVRAARASRLLLYRKAAEAYDNLRAVERLEEQALEHLLMHSLVGPMERWRQFELALALSMANAIAHRIRAEVSLKSILPGTADAIIDVGPFGVRWQQAGPGFTPIAFEGWEAREVEIIREYGLSPGYERPDVVVFSRRTNLVVAVGEAKYFDRDDWRDRLRHAARQIVTYARAYGGKQDVNELLGRSIIALWSAGDQAPKPTTAGAPWVTSFEEMRSGLDTWATRALPE